MAAETPPNAPIGATINEIPRSESGATIEHKSATIPDRYWYVASLFLFSGVSALIYQVAWKRHLSLFFGSDVYSSAITLSAFMAGLAIGSYISERLADKLRRPLLWYGILEIAVGAYALFFLYFLYGFEPIYQAIYLGTFDTAPWLYNGFRITIAAGVLLIPTCMMGATLPLIVASFVTNNDELGRYSGRFYSINTLGALSGVLIAGFLLFPLIGVSTTTEIAVATNILVGMAVITLDCVLPRARPRSQWAKAEKRSDKATERPGYDAAIARVALVAIFSSGLAALALEVVWTRILTQFYSGTVYSFSIMLACFLFGIFYGSRKASQWVDGAPDLIRTFAFLELGIGASVAVIAALTFFAPSVFGAILWGMTAITGGGFGVASVASMFIVSAVMIAGTTIMLGATFPVAVRICTPAANLAGYGTGRVYAANTSGAILGAFLGGFVLIPVFGSWNSLAVLAALFCGTGFFLLHKAKRHRIPPARSDLSPKAKAVALSCIAVVASVIAIVLPKPIILNYNRQASTQPEVLYQGEGVAHSVDIVRNDKGVTIMMVDGNIEADTSYVQRRHFILKAHLPLVLHHAPRDVAVVGLGLGVTLGATARNPEVESIDVIELSPEMAKAHRQLAGHLDNLLAHPKISLRIDDGRNYLKMTKRQYDMITADPIHPRITGVGYLYTKEYYESIKQRLKPRGIVTQWMPIYSISPTSFDVAFRTFASVFENATFWYVRGHGLFVATLEPVKIDYASVKERFTAAAVLGDFASIDIASPEEFLSYLLMGPKEISEYLAGQSLDQVVNTDDNAYLEYRTPFEFLRPTKDVVSRLAPYAGYDPAILTNISDEERQAVRAAWEGRRNRILTELEETLK